MPTHRLARRAPFWLCACMLLAWLVSMSAAMMRPLQINTVCRGGGEVVAIVQDLGQDTAAGHPGAHAHGKCVQCMPADLPVAPAIDPTPPGCLPSAPIFSLAAARDTATRSMPPLARGPPLA